MSNRPIGIFDSGIGGITVLKKLKERLPKENYIYLGDTINFPYGEKTAEEIIEFSRNNIKKLLEFNVKLIVIACGTATSQALEIMKKEFNVPIIGIISPTVEFVKNMNIEKVGVIATSGTIRSGAWEKSLRKSLPQINVINKACPLLASIAEEGRAKTKESLEAVHSYMQIFKENMVDTIILGCTHYPIYDEIIRKEFDHPITLINTGDSIARKIENLLNEKNMKNNVGSGEYKIILTKDEADFFERAERMLK